MQDYSHVTPMNFIQFEFSCTAERHVLIFLNFFFIFQSEAELRRWAIDQKDGRHSCKRRVFINGCPLLLDKDDLIQSKMLHGQQKLLLKALLPLQTINPTVQPTPGLAGTSNGQVQDHEGDHHRLEATAILHDNENMAPRCNDGSHQLQDMYVRMVTDHMRLLQTVTLYTMQSTGYIMTTQALAMTTLTTDLPASGSTSFQASSSTFGGLFPTSAAWLWVMSALTSSEHTVKN